MMFIFFDCSAGASGDMILGALLDLGVNKKKFQEKMAGLSLPVKIIVRPVKRCGLRALGIKVKIDPNRQVTRKFTDVEKIISRSHFSDKVKARSISIFKRLFEAEAKVHGQKFKDAHLHEAGADDAIIDIVGTCYLIEELEAEKIYASSMNLGSGWIKAAHGILPVPPPAVAELTKGAPVYSAHVNHELVTPTGAAILTTLVDGFMKFPELEYQKIGYGAGTSDFPEIPNVLRAFYGKFNPKIEDEKIKVIEATVDDASPQLLAHFMERAFSLGALDVTLSPVVMKKNRLGTELTVLAAADKIDKLIELIFKETTSIGVRFYPVERRILRRSFETVKVLGEAMKVKVSWLGDEEANVQPEYEEALSIARKSGKPMKKVLQLAIGEYFRRR